MSNATKGAKNVFVNLLRVSTSLVLSLLISGLAVLLIGLGIDSVFCPVNTENVSVYDASGKWISGSGSSIYPSCGLSNSSWGEYVSLGLFIVFALVVYFLIYRILKRIWFR